MLSSPATIISPLQFLIMHSWPHQHLTCPNSLVDASNLKPSRGLILFALDQAFESIISKSVYIQNSSRLESASNTSIASSNKNLISLTQRTYLLSVRTPTNALRGYLCFLTFSYYTYYHMISCRIIDIIKLEN